MLNVSNGREADIPQGLLLTRSSRRAAVQANLVPNRKPPPRPRPSSIGSGQSVEHTIRRAGALPHERMMRCIELYGREVIPRAREQMAAQAPRIAEM